MSDFSFVYDMIITDKEVKMEFNEYHEWARKYDLFKPTGNYNTVSFIEKVLGLTGEAGETADKIKKILRDKEGKISEEDKGEIVKELGDVLWYLAAISTYLGVDLEEVAKGNIGKLESRRQRNLLHGEGDNR